jgi:poly(A) polymerase
MIELTNIGKVYEVMQHSNLEIVVRAEDARGLLQQWLPEVHALKGVEQARLHHAEGDAFEHTMLVLSHAKHTLLAQWAALLHDVGKAKTQKIEDGKISFLRHEEVSAQMAPLVLARFGFPQEFVEQVTALVANHMRARDHRKWGPKALRKFVRDLGPLVDDVLDLFEADSLGSLTPEGTPAKDGVDELRERIKSLPPEVEPRPKPLLSGDVIMRVLGIGPGPAVGEVQKWLEGRAQVWAGLGKVVDAEWAEQLIVDEYAALPDIVKRHRRWP